MPLDLMEIYTIDNQKLFRLRTLSESISTGLNTITSTKINDLGKDALAAFKSKVPVYSKQLRNDHIQIDFAKKNQEIPKVKVYIADQPHTATRRGRIKTSATLAKILNSGTHEFSGRPMKRSQNSIPAAGYLSSYSGIGQGQGTAGWITDAQLSFLSKVGLILNG